MNKQNRKREQLRAHLTRFVDRARWPDYVLTEEDLDAYIEHESTGKGQKPEPLAWSKKVEEITIHQLWCEMSEMWAAGFGWGHIMRNTIQAEWNERRGSNIWLKRLLSIAKGISERGFMESMLRYSGFTDEDRERYLTMKFGKLS